MSTALKRPGQEVTIGPKAKLPRHNWYIVLEEESDLPTDESEESVYSIQGKETDIAKDTSDTSSPCSSSSERPINLEYEVDSLSEKENPLGNASLSSDVEAQCSASLLMVCNESGSTFADSSTDASSFDPEIPRADYWTCVQCKTKYNKPGFRYCQKCYQRELYMQCRSNQKYPSFTFCKDCFKVRKDFFPPRPRRKRKRNRNNGQKMPKVEKSISNASTVSISDLAKDEPIAGPSHLSVDSGISSLESSSHSLISKCDMEAGNSSNTECIYGTCITCMKNPKNGVFLHGKIGHICCCYQCALKVWTETRSCPLCKCKVRNVIKAIVL